MAINDDKKAFYAAALGRTGALPDLEYEWLQSQVAVADRGSVNDMWVKMLRNQGLTGSLNDMLSKAAYPLNPNSSGKVLPTANIVGFGDSITVGQNATIPANYWINIVGARLGATVLNAGIAGTVLQNSNDAGAAPRASNGRDRYVADVTGANKRDTIFLAYGFNDARYTGAPTTFNLSFYAIDMREVLIGLLAAGYTSDKIVIVSPYYITDTGLATGSAGFTGQTRAVFESFVEASRKVAREFGCWYIDVYAAMLAGGGASLIDVDNIHPTDAGHLVIANAVMNATRSPITLPVNTFLYDTFTDTDATILTNHTGEKGGSWLIQTGAAPGTPNAIQNNRVWSPTNQGVYRAAPNSIDPSPANYYVEAVLSFVSTIAGDNVGVIGRASAVANTYYMARWNQSGGWQLYSNVAGSFTQLGSTVADTFTSGEKTVRLTMNGTTISMSVDGVTIISVTDANIATGRPGVRFGTIQTSTTGIHISSIQAAFV